MTEFLALNHYAVCAYRPTYERRLSKYNSNQSRVHANYKTELLNESNAADEITYE